jgi:hypothetical protein
MKSDTEEIVIALGRIERTIEQTTKSNNDRLEDICIALDNIARSQATIAKALVFITEVVDRK